jgi:hypothetical protein
MSDASPPSRTISKGWRDGGISFPALVILIVAMVVGALGGASIGGAGGLVITIAVLLAVVVLLIRWTDAPR